MLLPINNKTNIFTNSSFAKNLNNKKHNYDLSVELGINKNTLNAETLAIDNAPHVLIAGTTGSGKSVCLNTIITSLVTKNSPLEVRLILIDPKRVEFNAYSKLPHLICPVINNQNNSLIALRWLIDEMEKRYSLMNIHNVKTISELREVSIKDGYNFYLPSIVCIIDELANLIRSDNQKEFESLLMQLAEKSRASGIHLILSTQRPSMGAVKGDLKSNLPTRIAFKVASKQDSRIIIDKNGAESLLGKGDMLFLDTTTGSFQKIQGSWIEQKEINAVVDFWNNANTEINLINEKSNFKINLCNDTKSQYISQNTEQFLLEAIKIKQMLQSGIKAEDILNGTTDSFVLLDNALNMSDSYFNITEPIKFSFNEAYNIFIEHIYGLQYIKIDDIVNLLNITRKEAENIAIKAIKEKRAYRAYKNIISPYASIEKVGIFWN